MNTNYTPGERDTVAERPSTTKPTNPKDMVGLRKWRQFFCVPQRVLWEMGVGMLEGARKYGRFNYRVTGVLASVYVDAAKGHIACWEEGEDIDPDSGLSHITKAMCSLAVLRDSMLEGNFVDDRAPYHEGMDEHKEYLQRVVDELFERHPVPAAPMTSEDRSKARGEDSVDFRAPEKIYSTSAGTKTTLTA